MQHTLQRNNQLHKYRTRKCLKTRWQLSYCMRMLHTCKKSHLFSVDKYTCSKPWMYSFLSISTSMISVVLQDHSEYQISTNRSIGKTETTHKSKKTITGLESRAGWLLDTPKEAQVVHRRLTVDLIWFQVCKNQLQRGKGQLFSRSTIINWWQTFSCGKSISRVGTTWTDIE